MRSTPDPRLLVAEALTRDPELLAAYAQRAGGPARRALEQPTAWRILREGGVFDRIAELAALAEPGLTAKLVLRQGVLVELRFTDAAAPDAIDANQPLLPQLIAAKKARKAQPRPIPLHQITAPAQPGPGKTGPGKTGPGQPNHGAAGQGGSGQAPTGADPRWRKALIAAGIAPDQAGTPLLLMNAMAWAQAQWPGFGAAPATPPAPQGKAPAAGPLGLPGVRPAPGIPGAVMITFQDGSVGTASPGGVAGLPAAAHDPAKFKAALAMVGVAPNSPPSDEELVLALELLNSGTV